jgi:hypothetical protein
MTEPELPSDRDVVAVQLDRPPRSPIDVVARCHLELPVVIAVPPHLDDGTPFPTRYWLTCPLAVLRVSRLESAGGVRAAEARIAADPAFAARHAAASTRYAAERDVAISPDAPPHRPQGGVGGAQQGVKCLHAHYADHAAGNDNPVGEETAASIEPLDCSAPCATRIDGAVVRNPDWREPRR